MSDQQDVDEIPAKGGKSKLIIGAVVALLVLGNVGLGVALVLGKGGAAEASEPGAKAKVQEPPSKPMDEPGPLFALEPFVVNLQDPGGNHYLRTTVQIELDREESRQVVEARKIMMRDRFIATLSAKRLEELRAPEDRERLRQELLKAGQDMTTQRIVRAVYFTEFLTQ